MREVTLPVHDTRDLPVLRSHVDALLEPMAAVSVGTTLSDAARAQLAEHGPFELTIHIGDDAVTFRVPGADLARFDETLFGAARVRGDTVEVDLAALKGEPTEESLLQRLLVSRRLLVHARRKEQESREQAEEAARQLRAANRDLETIAAAVAHDLKEPLNIIRMFATMLQADAAPGDERAQAIVDSAGHMADMLDGLMQIARFRSGERGPCDFRTVCTQVLEQARARPEAEGADLVCTGSAEVPMSRGHLRTLLQNLVTNAVKYRRPDVVAQVAVTASTTPDSLQITVTDNGMGIPEDRIPSLFSLFSRLPRDRGIRGTGVGLAVVARLVEEYDGRLDVSSTVGTGTRFAITIPRRSV